MIAFALILLFLNNILQSSCQTFTQMITELSYSDCTKVTNANPTTLFQYIGKLSGNIINVQGINPNDCKVSCGSYALLCAHDATFVNAYDLKLRRTLTLPPHF
jgi:hypothetical protein